MRSIFYAASVAVSIAIFGTTTVFADGHKKAIEQELDQYNDTYNEIIENYDLEAFVALYNDKPLWIAPKETPAAGLDVPRGTFGFIIKNQGKLTHTFDQLVVSDDGSQAVMIGSYNLNIQKVGAKAKGTYLFVLKREGKGWKIAVDMFNEHVQK